MSDKGFYIAAMSTKSDGGIYRFAFDVNGVPEQRSFTALPNANYLAYSPDRNYLYSTCAVADGIGGCAAFCVESDNSLVFLNQMAADGPGACHLTTDPAGKFLYCANYHSSSIAEFNLTDSGRIAERIKVIRHVGQGINPERQKSPHPHFTMFTPDARYLCVIDLGLDAIMLYPFNPKCGLDSVRPYTFKVTPAGTGPRHLVFNRAGNRAYLINELGNSVVALAYADGKFNFIQAALSIPPHLQCPTKAAAIRLSEDENFLFASNRGFDSIACYQVDQTTGYLKLHDMELSGGSSPRDINFLPGMKKFAAANEFSDIVVFFEYDERSGKLTPNGQFIKLTRPLAICW